MGLKRFSDTTDGFEKKWCKTISEGFMMIETVPCHRTYSNDTYLQYVEVDLHLPPPASTYLIHIQK